MECWDGLARGLGEWGISFAMDQGTAMTRVLWIFGVGVDQHNILEGWLIFSEG